MKRVAKLWISGLMIFASLFVVTGCHKSGSGDLPSTVVVNPNLLVDKKVDDFQFTNTNITITNGATAFSTTITNTTNQDQYIKNVIIRFYDENENVIQELVGLVVDKIPANKHRTISANHFADLSQASSVSYEIIR